MAPSPGRAAVPATSVTPTAHPLLARILSGLVLGPATLAVVWFGGPAFDLFLVLAGGLMAREWSRMTARDQAGWTGLALALMAIAALGATAAGVPPGQVVVGLLGGALVVYGLGRSGGVQAPIWLAAGVVSVGLPCVAFVWLRGVPEVGRAAVFWLFAVVWATDIGAYAVGRSVGGPRLAPRISPNKTWSGLLGGVLAAAVVGGGGAAWFGAGAWLGPALLGGGLAVVAQGGDLGESLAKRRFGIKDTGALIPGHGGLLDRVDGLLPTAPAMAMLVWLKGGSVFGW
jgi:phosphatidate cytidylyltransferase